MTLGSAELVAGMLLASGDWTGAGCLLPIEMLCWVQDGPDIDPRWPQDDPSWPQQVQDGARIAEAWPKSAILEAMPQKVEKRGSTAFRGAWLDFNVFLLCFGCVDFNGFD